VHAGHPLSRAGRPLAAALVTAATLLAARPAGAGAITFHDVAHDPAYGIDYQRAPSTTDALAEARRLGVHVLGFESMCGLPLCLVPPSLHATLALAEIPAGFDRGEFLKADACRGCRYETTCFGLRRGYAELYGTGELRAV